MKESKIKVGAKLRIRPTIYGSKSEEKTGIQEAIVTYVHPEHRYFTVEFQSPFGYSFRESIPFWTLHHAEEAK